MAVYEIIGWIGSFTFIISYLLLSTEKLEANKLPYQLMNVIGGICLVISAYGSHDKPNLFTNLVWVCIGLYAIISIVRKSKSKS